MTTYDDSADSASPAGHSEADRVPGALAGHLHSWLGVWPPSRPVTVVAHARAELPGWDGTVRPVRGVIDAAGRAVIGTLPIAAARLALSDVPPDDLDAVLAALPAALGQPRTQVHRGVFRWSTAPSPSPDAGIWVDSDDPRVPAWLHPFGGEVLIALEQGRYVAGVGIKRHDENGREIAVGTDAAARGRGLARRLVAQAARRVLAEGAVPTYLHAPDNVASAHVAEAAGFPDRGWSVLGLRP